MKESGTVIFGGTAAYHLHPADFATVLESRTLETPYGRSPQFHRLLTAQGTAVWFTSRHGEGTLERSARFVNHRATLWAAQSLGAKRVLSWNGVGAINPALRVGDVVVPSGVMDWTRARFATFGETAPHWAAAQTLRARGHTFAQVQRMSDPATFQPTTAQPFDEATRQAILAQVQTPLLNPVYVCTEGPRLETAVEIRLAGQLGADVVGMTLCPEVWLAAELGLAYASLCLVTNFATGLWHLDPRRDFGPSVAERALPILLAVVEGA